MVLVSLFFRINISKAMHFEKLKAIDYGSDSCFLWREVLEVIATHYRQNKYHYAINAKYNRDFVFLFSKCCYFSSSSRPRPDVL